MQSDSYVVIQGWMCNELELKGNDLLIFALIHGFSQDGESRFSGSRSYIAETFNISLPTVDKAIKNLIEKGLIEQHKCDKNGVVFNEYNSLYPVKKLYRPRKETLHNNNSNKQEGNSIKNTISENTVGFLGSAKKTTKETLYTKVLNSIKAFTDDVLLQNELLQFFNLQIEIYKNQGKQYYFNIWKSRLNKLKEFDRKDWLLVVKQATENGWQNFYPLKNFDTKHDKAWEKGVKSEKYTEEELQDLEKWQKDMRKKGFRVDF